VSRHGQSLLSRTFRRQFNLQLRQLGSEGFLQPDHRVDHGILDCRPLRLVAPVTADCRDVSDPATLLVVEPLPGQVATEGPLDVFLVLAKPVKNLLVLCGLSRTPVDPQLDPAFTLTDGIVKGQPPHAGPCPNPSVLARRDAGMSGGLYLRTAEKPFPE